MKSMAMTFNLSFQMTSMLALIATPSRLYLRLNFLLAGFDAADMAESVYDSTDYAWCKCSTIHVRISKLFALLRKGLEQPPEIRLWFELLKHCTFRSTS